MRRMGRMGVMKAASVGQRGRRPVRGFLWSVLAALPLVFCSCGTFWSSSGPAQQSPKAQAAGDHPAPRGQPVVVAEETSRVQPVVVPDQPARVQPVVAPQQTPKAQ